MNISALLPLLAPLIKSLLEDVIHPEVQKLEAQIGSDAVKTVLAALDPVLFKLAEDELAKLSAPKA